MFADVAVPLPIDQTFTYAVQATIERRLSPGCRVLVPFGSRHVVGIAVRIHDEERQGKVKRIQQVLDEKPLLSPRMLELARWMASYYLAPIGETIRVMLPPGLLDRNVSVETGPLTSRYWPAKQQLAVVEINSRNTKLTARQTEVLQLLQKASLPVLVQPFLRRACCSDSMLKNLASKGSIRIEPVEARRSSELETDFNQDVKRHSLTSDQQRIVNNIRRQVATAEFCSILIHGVTGSGKTEIYLNAISSVLGMGRSALVLVPEIGLTPQMLGYFRAWFGTRVAILHSALSDGERFDQWRRIWEGEATVVVGTRSAVFAPLKEVGIVLVDEEHDDSYKQEDLPRYHARDVALKRGQIESVPVILGSATPQLETYYHAIGKGRPRYEALTSRVLERQLPSIKIVDMRAEFQRLGKATTLSETLQGSIRDRLQRREQTLILLNRRGYSSSLLCRSCGNVETCQECSISLTYHRNRGCLTCHYCGSSKPVPKLCSKCSKVYLHFLGEGTEQIQKILKDCFPEALVDRLDRDTVGRKGSLRRILGAVAACKTDILVGTQMIAKGHDFPNVTLVGVLMAEQALRMPDFRAAEKTFQLLTQVAGRAGRGEQLGEVVIQAYYPNHYSLKYACAQDYRLFFEEEIRFRRRFQYPPFTSLANLVIHSRQQKRSLELATNVADLLQAKRSCFSSARKMRILGPAPAAREKLKGRYRFQILIKTTRGQELREVLGATLGELRRQGESLKRISIDVDPVNLL